LRLQSQRTQLDNGETVKQLKAVVAMVAALMTSTAFGQDSAADPAPVRGESPERGLGEVGSSRVELTVVGANTGFYS
jgi:hypothetical protein